MEPPHLNICVVGAGLGGLSAAIGISRSNHMVTILEQASSLGEVGAGIQIPPNCSHILSNWNLLPKIASHSVVPEAFQLRSYLSGKILSTQETMPFCQERYGAPYLHIHRADYHKVLVEDVERLGVKIRLNSRVKKVDFSKPSVVLATGETLEFDLIVGADGLKSTCRESLLGQPAPPRLTGDLAYRIIVKTSEMRKHPSLLEFVEHPAINVWMGPSSHAVTYLLANGSLFNIVLACPDNLPEFIQTQKADVREMNEMFEGWDPRLRLILSLVKETSKWRLSNSEEMKSWTHPEYPSNFVLLGDACHATAPYLASGAAMAVEDGAALGELLSKDKFREKGQLKDILRIFEKIRKERTTKVVEGSSGQGMVFHARDGVEQEERDKMMTEGQDEPWEGFPNKYHDPVFRDWLWGYDVNLEVEKTWTLYESGKFPLTNDIENPAGVLSERERWKAEGDGVRRANRGVVY